MVILAVRSWDRHANDVHMLDFDNVCMIPLLFDKYAKRIASIDIYYHMIFNNMFITYQGGIR